MVAANSLSEQDLEDVRAELAANRPFTVWFTASAVGVPAGGSAKVISVEAPAEGDFIQVKAAGSRDTLFCSPSELTRVRPARKRAAAAPAAKEPAAQGPLAQRPAAARTGSAPSTSAPVPAPATAAPAPKVPAAATATAPVPVMPGPKAPERPRPSGRAARPVEVTVTLSATAEGEWSVEVTSGKKRSVRPTPVQPADVAKAARSLPSQVAEAIDSSLQAARERQVERVERLRAELDAAQRALHELST